MIDLQDRVIVVTGSTRGIGAGIIRGCHEAGAYVMVHGRHEDKARQLAEELGDRASYQVGDLNEQGECEALIDSVVDRFGRIDGLVNNAAINPRTSIDNSDSELFDSIINTNLKAPLMLCRQAVSYFRKQKSSGSIVNIGSINAYCGQTDLLLYSMSKGGLMTMTRNLGDALGKEGIRVNQLNVGWTLTEHEMDIKAKEGYEPGWESRISTTYAPSGKLLQPEDIAHHAVFWLSEQSAPVNGSVIDVEQYPMIGRNKIAGD